MVGVLLVNWVGIYPGESIGNWSTVSVLGFDRYKMGIMTRQRHLYW